MAREEPRRKSQVLSPFWAPAVLLTIALLSTCGSPTSPGGLSVQFLVAPSVGGSFTLSLQGRTYTSSSLQTVLLTPGTYEMSGTATGTVNQGTQLIVGFTGGGTAYGQGGAESGTIVSSVGPMITASGCGIGYYTADGSPYQFRFRFSVTSDPAKAC